MVMYKNSPLYALLLTNPLYGLQLFTLWKKNIRILYRICFLGAIYIYIYICNFFLISTLIKLIIFLTKYILSQSTYGLLGTYDAFKPGTLTRHIKSSFVLLLLHGNNDHKEYFIFCIWVFVIHILHIGYNLQRSICIAEIANVLQPKVDHSNFPKQIHHILQY